MLNQLNKYVNLNVFIVFIIFFINHSFLKGQSLTEISLLDEQYQNLISNVKYQNTVLKKSNIWLFHLDTSNTYLIKEIEKSKNFFGNDLKKKLNFYEMATTHYFYKLSDKENKKKALKLWNSLIELDFELLKEAEESIPTNNWGNFKSDLSGVVLEKAFEMQGYLYLLKDDSPKEFSGVDYDIMTKVCEKYEKYFTNGLNYSKHLNLNFLAYFLDRGEYSNAYKTYKRVETFLDNYYKQRLAYLRLMHLTNNELLYKAVKDYLLLMRSEINLNENKQDKYFNNANSILFPKNKYGEKRSYRFEELNHLNRERIRKAIKTYIKSLKSDPNMPEANYNLGIIYAKLNNVPKAILYLKRSLKYKSTFKTLYSLGLLEMKLENYAAAYKFFKEAEFYQKKSSSLYNNLSICSKYFKDPQVIEPRIFYINKAISIQENDYRLYITKGKYFKDIGDYNGFTNQINTAMLKILQIEDHEYRDLLDVFSVKSTKEMPKAIAKSLEKVGALIGFKPENISIPKQYLKYQYMPRYFDKSNPYKNPLPSQSNLQNKFDPHSRNPK